MAGGVSSSPVRREGDRKAARRLPKPVHSNSVYRSTRRACTPAARVTGSFGSMYSSEVGSSLGRRPFALTPVGVSLVGSRSIEVDERCFG
jgi:hypothetical protein